MRVVLFFLILLAVAGAGYYVLDQRLDRQISQAMEATDVAKVTEELPDQWTERWIVAGGRVEPVTEERVMGFDASGVIETIFVEEGQTVRIGQSLARLESGEQRADRDIALLAASQKELEYRKLLSGGRKEEREEAWSKVRQARHEMDQALKEARRRAELVKKNYIAPEEADRAWKDYNVSKDRYNEALKGFQLAQDPFRQEDVAKAELDYESAQAQVRRAEAVLAKRELRAPVDGTILRIHRREGEVTTLLVDNPVLTIGDIQHLNVRAEVDEKDIGRISAGQSAYVTADAFPDRKFTGRVSRVGVLMGAKQVMSDAPEERMDRKVLDVIISLDTVQGTAQQSMRQLSSGQASAGDDYPQGEKTEARGNEGGNSDFAQTGDGSIHGLISGLRVDVFIDTGGPTARGVFPSPSESGLPSGKSRLSSVQSGVSPVESRLSPGRKQSAVRTSPETAVSSLSAVRNTVNTNEARHTSEINSIRQVAADIGEVIRTVRFGAHSEQEHAHD